MNYWLIAIPREDMEHCIEIGCYGRNAAAKFLSVEPGDKIACYVSRESKIIALGEITRGYYRDEKIVFRASEKSTADFRYNRSEQSLFLHRINFSATKLEREIDFKPLVNKLSFIKKPAYWPAYIRRGFAKLSENDWKTICNAAGVSA